MILLAERQAYTTLKPYDQMSQRLQFSSWKLSYQVISGQERLVRALYFNWSVMESTYIWFLFPFF